MRLSAAHYSARVDQTLQEEQDSWPQRQHRVDVVLRMLLLKHVRDWSYEVLTQEVRANLVYRGIYPGRR